MSNPNTIDVTIAQMLNKRHMKKLANHLNIELIKESKKFILDATTSISNE